LRSGVETLLEVRLQIRKTAIGGKVAAASWLEGAQPGGTGTTRATLIAAISNSDRGQLCLDSRPVAS
jgi:hypothetical protein